MSEKPQIKKIKVTVAMDGGGGGMFSAETLRVKLDMNTLATATIAGLQSAEPVKLALAPDVFAAMRDKQKTRLAGRDRADVSIYAEDGSGGTLSFVGFMTAPVLEISRNHIADSMSVLAEDALVDGLDLSIYSKGGASMREETDKGPLAEAYGAAEEGQALEMLSKITEVLVGAYEESLNAAPTPSLQKLLEQQHGLNTKRPLEIWKGILSNGEAKFEAWAAAIAASGDLKRTIVDRAGNLLQQRASGFWQTLNGVLGAFQLHYVPSPDGRGKITLSSDKVGEPTGSYTAHASSVSLSDGSVKLMQPGGVVMLAPSAKRLRPETSGGDPRLPGSIAGQFPRDLLDGYIHREPPPFWLLGPEGDPMVPMDSPPGESGELNLDLEQYKERIDDADKKKDDLDDTTSGILNELCEIIFDQIRLGDSTASVTVPLDFTVPIGRRLTFDFGDGAKFVGFIDGVMHNIDLTGGKQLSSSTQLSLTHIEY